jgi:hypothetical protein
MKFKPTIAAILLISLSISCAEEKEKPAEEKSVAQLIIGDPASYGSDSLIIFPVGMTYLPQESYDDNNNEDVYAETEASEEYAGDEVYNEANGQTSYGYSVKMSDQGIASNSYGTFQLYENLDVENVDIRNLIFYNKFSGESKKLLSDKLHIISFSIHYEFGEEPIIMYDVVKIDYNQDSLYNRKDPVMLFISDMNGDNFTQLTAEDETYLTYFYYYESNRMLLKVSKDGDGNKKFDPYDQTIFRDVDLKNPGIGKTLFGEDMIKELQEQL